MDRRRFSLSVMMLAAVAGCGGGGTDGEPTPGPTPAPPPKGPELATDTSLPAGTVFAQSSKALDGNPSVAPNQANRFELGGAFTILDGGGNQFDEALSLSLEVGGRSLDFPDDLTYPELTPLGPELGKADGVELVTFSDDPQFVLSGTRSAVLHIAPDVRLQRTVNLAAAALHGVELQWSDYIDDGHGTFFNQEPGYYQVVVRSPLGALLATLYRVGPGGAVGTRGRASLTAFAGQTVVLSFERHLGSGYVAVDSVSAKDTTTGTEFIQNGDFERGGDGWNVPVHSVSQNIRSGVREAHGLSMQRTFYTQPNLMWGRMTDVFTNNTGSRVAATIKYGTNLGSNGSGFIYSTPGAAGGALSTWDTGKPGGGREVRFARDASWVFGKAEAVEYESTSTIDSKDGGEVVEVVFNVVVPAGDSVTLINFLVLSGGATGRTAADLSARAVDTDAIAADIAKNFRTNFSYQRGLTRKQLDTAKNL